MNPVKILAGWRKSLTVFVKEGPVKTREANDQIDYLIGLADGEIARLEATAEGMRQLAYGNQDRKAE